MSDIETESGHSSSSDHSGVSGGGKTRKSSMPKRLRLGSEASSPGLEEDDRDKKELEVNFSCKEAALEVLIYVCLSVCLSVYPSLDKLKF